MLKIKHLTKQFNGKKILNDVSLTVARGEIAVLLGSSGVGKSTLLRILNNLESIDHGTISLDDAFLDLASINKKHISGMVFQHFNLFEHLTVVQNITLALEKVMGTPSQEATALAHKLLAQYGLLDKAEAYASQLSGGQKQRLAIARALALKPQIICLDEPTSALDPLLTKYVASSIQELADKGYIVVVATHDTSLLTKLSCTIHVMKEGKILESASSKDFYAHQEKYPQIAQFIAGKEL